MSDRIALQNRIWRARFSSATADGHRTAESMRRSGRCKQVVWD